MGKLELRDLTIRYRTETIVTGLNLTVDDGEFFSLVGPSGVGKTSLLKTIAGLHFPDQGQIFINGREVTVTSADKRDTVLIFQKPLLFPFLNVFQNIAFGLKMAGMEQKKIQEKIADVLKLMELEGFERRKVHQLSGGQQQRVALARGLVLAPSLLLLDEPLSSLDPGLRLKMRDLIKKVQRKTNITMLFVTHDQAEALTISDRIGVLLDGRVQQAGTPHQLFYRPATAEVAGFFGNTNFLTGAVRRNMFCWNALKLPLVHRNQDRASGVVRPEDITISLTREDNSIAATVTSVSFEGALTRVTVTLGAEQLTVLTTRTGCRRGDRVWLTIDPENIHFF
ncbi:ABC transporter ATP-binding protein [Desulforhopalus singaporensis]|uniref:Spermidine/putrescine transport system ATP-binding protein n=1 Tax=Desulforhopalus singaporensis TaxID=91360 RepID=A0A1H0SWV6_9BACT|nr:ABC transporter ATP-binding protein [Desulforhopalus singaporensis]SDP46124.1 spermidine/putrescine transport system ATP-binding protein [Desulforhopalus singaporensis]